VGGQLEILNADRHRTVRMHEQPGLPAHFTMITIDEFTAAAAACPIFFAKDSASGAFYAGAMFGFEPGEVLVELSPAVGPAFRPLDLLRRGFLIADDGVAIDPAHPRFAPDAPTALFDDAGEPSTALRQIQRILGRLNSGAELTRTFIAELLEVGAIEPIDIALSFDDGQNLRLDGLYSVARDALNDLDDAQVVRLFRSGFLQAALCVANSTAHIPIMAQRRNDRLLAA
jgi:hypothetical protein